jgi:uncharacterized protein
MNPKRILVRFLAFTVSLLLLLIALQILGAALAAHATPLEFRPVAALAVDVCICVAMAAVYRVEVRWLERREPLELGRAHSVPYALYGALLGLALFCLVMAFIWAGGFATYGGAHASSFALSSLGSAAAAGVGEEIVFRGAIFRILEEGLGTLAALIISALLFGAIHAANPNATLVSSSAIALEAGVMLALAYALSRNLWFPIGLHFGWNFTEGGIFGAAVSGNRAHGLLSLPMNGPSLVTGGGFGPEASLISVAVCLCASVALGVATVRAGRWRKFR